MKLSEESTSKYQQRLMGAALSVKRGEKSLSDMPESYRDKIKGLLDMTEKQLEDFASTTHKGLPNKVEESLLEKVCIKENTTFDSEVDSYINKITSILKNEDFHILSRFYSKKELAFIIEVFNNNEIDPRSFIRIWNKISFLKGVKMKLTAIGKYKYIIKLYV